MKKMVNKVYLEGKLYEHKLEKKISGPNSKNPGTEFIQGSIKVAIDENCSNIIEVYYGYITAKTSKGNPNSTYDFLNNILTEKYLTAMGSSLEQATIVKVDTSIAVNDFYSRNNDLVSVVRNENGFIKQTPAYTTDDLSKRCKFEVDVLLSKVVRLEEVEEKGLPERMELHGYVFNFKNDIIPVKFVVKDEKGMDYFESLDVTSKNPVFTKVWGTEINQITKKEVVVETAFGDDVVDYQETSEKILLVTTAMSEPYEMDSEDTLQMIEVKNALSNREVMLAEKLKNKQEYEKQKNSWSVPNETKEDWEDLF